MVAYSYTLSYASEVTLRIKIVRNKYSYTAVCNHPMLEKDSVDTMQLQESWYFFSGPDDRNSVAVFKAGKITKLLDTIASEMYEGTEFYFRHRNEDAEKWFREHLYLGFALGDMPSRDIRLEVADTISERFKYL